MISNNNNGGNLLDLNGGDLLNVDEVDPLNANPEALEESMDLLL